MFSVRTSVRTATVPRKLGEKSGEALDCGSLELRGNVPSWGVRYLLHRESHKVSEADALRGRDHAPPRKL
jgi:hypothetical protein